MNTLYDLWQGSNTWSEPARMVLVLILQSSVLLGLALALTAALRRRSAATRHLILLAGLVGALLLPVARFSLPSLEIPILPAPEAAAAKPTSPGLDSTRSPRGGQEDSGPRVSGAAPAIPAGQAADQASRSTVDVESLVMLGAVGIGALFLLYLAAGVFVVYRLSRQSVPWPEPAEPGRNTLEELRARLGIRRPVSLRVHPDVRVPLTLGALHPRILLPSGAESWPQSELRSVLLHELGHVKRWDWLSQIAARTICSIQWFNPLAWLVTARLLVEAERASDDIVMTEGAAAPNYARQLLEMASLRRRELPVFGAVAMARRATLSDRIEAILDPSQRRSKPSPRLLLAVATGLLIMLCALAPARLVQASEAPSTARSEWPAAESDSDTDSDVDFEGDAGRDLDPDFDPAFDPDFHVDDDRRLSYDGAPPLLRAVARGDRVSARRLLDEGANPNEGATSLGTPLIVAAAMGDEGLVRLLLERGASTDLAQTIRRLEPHQLPRSPLGAAAQSGNPAVVDRLLEAGAPVDFAPEGDAPPLSIAAEHGHPEIVQRLLVAGADPNRVTPGDGTPLIAATRNEDATIVRMLLDAGADPDTWVDGDESPLFHAVASGKLGVLELLLEAGADPNVVWPGNGTPLQVAASSGDPRVVERLLQAAARPDLGSDGDGNALIAAAAHGRLDLLRTLLDAGADPNAAVEGDGDALIAAAAAGHLDAVRLLVQRGADVDQVVPGDENPLIQAAGAGHVDVVEYLLDAGADPNRAVRVRHFRGGTEVRTPLGQAIRNGHSEVERILRQRGAVNEGSYSARRSGDPGSEDQIRHLEDREGAWLVVDDSRLFVPAGVVVEFVGGGSLEFPAGDVAVVLPDEHRVFVDGEPLEAQAVITNDSSVHIGSGSRDVAWRLRAVSWDVLESPGTRIEDTDRRRGARIDTSRGHFYLAVDEDGREIFFQPNG